MLYKKVLQIKEKALHQAILAARCRAKAEAVDDGPDRAAELLGGRASALYRNEATEFESYFRRVRR
jgi:hypothetical protein